MPSTKDAGKLYIVSIPIGHADDITRRAVSTLQTVDAVICEERREGQRTLKGLGIEKPLIELNEHNETEMIQTVLLELMNGKNLALISDCGTPVFADPGQQLLTLLYDAQIQVVPVPGASSLMAAISICPFELKTFHFAGFLPPKTEERAAVLQRLAGLNLPIILMDTPYRLGKLLQEAGKAFGRKQQAFLALDLSLPREQALLGPLDELAVRTQGRKAEFILIIDRPQRRRGSR
jgi:16S rRNA (cytidine1402-2'-O)-methyltransferase